MGPGGDAGCWHAQPSACKTVPFETCFVRPTSPHSIWMMDICISTDLLKGFLIFLSWAPLTFHVTFHDGTCSANLKAEQHIR